MIWCTIVGLYIIIERKPVTRYPLLAPGLAAYTAAFTATYFVTPEYFVLFLVSYIGGLLIIVMLSYQALREPANARPEQPWLVRTAVAILIVGGLFWLVENLYCPQLRGLHFHVVFHFTCAAGPYCWLCFAACD